MNFIDPLNALPLKMLLLNFPAKSFKGGRYVQAEDKSPPVAETAFPLIFNIFEHTTPSRWQKIVVLFETLITPTNFPK